MKLNPEQIAWSRSYQVTLNKHLAEGRGVSLKPAYELGRKAVRLKLETLDVIRVHEQALVAIVKQKQPAKTRSLLIGRAKLFFMETIVPIENTHIAAKRDTARVNQLTQLLHRRTAESTASNRQLKRNIVHRQSAEASLKRSRLHLAKLLQKSTALQKQLRTKTHANLATHEEVRKKAGRQLQDEIVQALIAIKFRMEALRLSAHADMERLKKEIAETQLLVKQSVKAIQQLAKKIGA